MHMSLQKLSLGRETVYLIFVGILGIFVEWVLRRLEVYSFQANDVLMGDIAPLWMLSLWFLFGSTLSVSLKWLQGKIFISSSFGAIGGALSYFAGHRMGALILKEPLTDSLMIIAIVWAIATPVLARAASQAQKI